MIGDNFMWFPESSGWKVEGETMDSFFASKKAFELASFSFTMDNKEAVRRPWRKGKFGGWKGEVRRVPDR